MPSPRAFSAAGIEGVWPRAPVLITVDRTGHLIHEVNVRDIQVPAIPPDNDALLSCLVSPWNVRFVIVDALDNVRAGDANRLLWNEIRLTLLSHGFTERQIIAPTDRLCKHFYYLKD